MVELDDADGEHRGGKHREDEHLDDVADGCGCTEVWEHLSDRRTEE